MKVQLTGDDLIQIINKHFDSIFMSGGIEITLKVWGQVDKVLITTEGRWNDNTRMTEFRFVMKSLPPRGPNPDDPYEVVHVENPIF